MIVAGFNDLADSRREFATPLDASTWIAHVHEDFRRIALQDGTNDGLESLRIGVLIDPIGVEEGQQ